MRTKVKYVPNETVLSLMIFCFVAYFQRLRWRRPDIHCISISIPRSYNYSYQKETHNNTETLELFNLNNIKKYQKSFQNSICEDPSKNIVFVIITGAKRRKFQSERGVCATVSDAFADIIKSLGVMG